MDLLQTVLIVLGVWPALAVIVHLALLPVLTASKRADELAPAAGSVHAV